MTRRIPIRSLIAAGLASAASPCQGTASERTCTGSGHRTQTTALGPAVGAAGSSQDRENAAGWEGRPGVIAILVLLIIQLVSSSCCT